MNSLKSIMVRIYKTIYFLLFFLAFPGQARLKEEERLAKLGDNARERALESMMGGVLEVKKEDELKKDVPPPTFVQEGKPEDEWSEEELRLYKVYYGR